MNEEVVFPSSNDISPETLYNNLPGINNTHNGTYSAFNVSYVDYNATYDEFYEDVFVEGINGKGN